MVLISGILVISGSVYILYKKYNSRVREIYSKHIKKAVG